MKSIGLALIVLGALTFAPSLSAQIKQPPSYEINLPGLPFGVVASRDQRWIFVSLPMGHKRGIAVLQNTGGKIQLVRTAPMTGRPLGMVLTHNEDRLIVAAQDRIVFFDTRKLESGENDTALQWVSDGAGAGSTYVNVTADDKTLFVSDESAGIITVIDLDRVHLLGPDSGANSKRANPDGAPDAVIGKIPVGIAPVALTFSKDQRWLFSTSEIARSDWGWPPVLEDEAGTGKVPEGGIVVIDVAKARTDSAESVVARVPAGGSPVRLALSSDGSRLFVSARNSNAVLVFNTADLVGNPNNAKPVKIPVGASPVPLVLVKNGSLALVGNSDRFGANAEKKSTLTLIDTSRIGTKKSPEIGQIPCGAFPREFHLSADGQTLFLTNFRSRTLQVLDVNRLMELIK